MALTRRDVYRHAGYSYSGPAAAWAYKSIDTTGMCVLDLRLEVHGLKQPIVREYSFWAPRITCT
jgi:hypothetical protein